jgi:hypothetical protein
MAGLCAPCQRFAEALTGHLRMTRGRCGSLVLHRKGLAPSTPCRSPGASQMFSGMLPKADISELCNTSDSCQCRAFRRAYPVLRWTPGHGGRRLGEIEPPSQSDRASNSLIAELP